MDGRSPHGRLRMLPGTTSPHPESFAAATLTEPSIGSESRVDVTAAKETFAELERQLSRGSTGHYYRDYDAEKGIVEEDTFNLRDYLASTNAAHDEAGIISRHKRVGVTWSDLEVIVPGGAGFKNYAPTIGKAVVDFVLTPVLLSLQLFRTLMPQASNFPTSTILHCSNGLLKPGEMCLVLGCPGSGCTTFLKAISNQRDEYAHVGGKVHYAGIDAAEMAKLYKSEVVYNQEDDIHASTLTVAQTLRFALSTKTPGKRLPGLSGKAFNEEILDVFLKMFNISHTSDTLVGDAFVQGISGGERKRVSLAEMMATRAHVTCWDNSTRGLDASTALDYVRSLRVITDVLQQTTFVTLYQASESIYRQFDKVLVLDKSRQIYFGPATEARKYFISLGYKDLPRQTTADYLTGCTDPNERQFAAGQSADTVPSTPEALEEAWRTSKYYRSLEDEREAYEKYMETEKNDQEEFRHAVLEDKKKGVSKKSPYTLGLMGQVKALVIRQLQLRWQDRFQLYTSFMMSTGLAIILGASYYNLPPTANGGFTRGSIIFVAMLITCLDAFAEMPSQMLGRPLLYKQVNYGFYRPSAVALNQLLADVPFSASRILIFNIIVYFMCNLARSPGGFFTFHLFQYTTFLAMQAFFRLLGTIFSNFHVAFRVAVFFVTTFITYTGYMIPRFKMKKWLSWFYYIDPLAYGYGGMMSNEFSRTDLTCDGSFVVPRNAPGVTKYPAQLGPNQACTLFGSKPGSSIVLGRDYLEVGFRIKTSSIWRMEFLFVIGFAILCQTVQVLILEYYKHGSPVGGISIFAKETTETKELNEALRAHKDNPAKALQKLQNVSSGKVFTWENLNYIVPIPGGKRRLLHDVFGYVKPGSLTALMGASGAGKTTCLDVLAQRKNIGVVTGDILIDGRLLGGDFARGTAYAEQMDVHEGTATVREAMRFSAELRQPFNVPRHEKHAYVEDMISLLELHDLADAMVYSLSTEARKRLTIGVELAAKPELLLFLDEPTSGLDSSSAWNLVRFLRKLADCGQAILCTIHQPSSLLFESFDRLLLLETGGETVYFGDIGKDSKMIREYFARYGAVCPFDMYPAEYMLEAIGAGVTPRVGPKDWKDIWLESPELAKVKEEIKEIKRAAIARPTGPNHGLTKTYATPFLNQVRIVSKRSIIALWRSPDYIWTRLYVHLFISLIVSLPMLRLGHSARELQYRVFGIFWVTVLPVIIVFQIEPAFIMNRMIFIREASSRIYSPYVFAIGQLLSEIPYSIICALVYWVLMVWPMGFGMGSEGTNGNGYHLLIIIFLEFFGVSLGQLIGAISPSIQIAALFNNPIALILTTFCGVTIPYPQLAHFWKSWLYQLTPHTRVMAGMLSTELKGLKITCKPDEFAVFNPPSGQTCLTWANEFVSVFGGYIDNPSATEACRYCQYKAGDDFFTPLNIDFDKRWRDAFILFSFLVANIILTIIASRYLRFAKR